MPKIEADRLSQFSHSSESSDAGAGKSFGLTKDNMKTAAHFMRNAHSTGAVYDARDAARSLGQEARYMKKTATSLFKGDFREAGANYKGVLHHGAQAVVGLTEAALNTGIIAVALPEIAVISAAASMIAEHVHAPEEKALVLPALVDDYDADSELSDDE